MNVEKKFTIAIEDDSGTEIMKNDVLMFVMNGRTRLAYFDGLDARSRAMLTDFVTGEKYTCMIGSITKSKVIQNADSGGAESIL